MSLATNIKEFADVLHNIYAQQLSSIDNTDLISDGVMPLVIPKIVVLQQACIYLAKTLGNQIFSLISFQWLRDFSYFPLISHEIGSSENIIADTFLSSPGSHLFSFSKDGVVLSSPNQGSSLFFNSFLKSDCLLTGFVNSFFFSLPFSLPHLITVRRIFSQGVPAAIASIFGTVAAHSLLLFGVIYGIRFLVIPYYSLQPLTFLIGIVIMAVVITEFVKEKRIYLVPVTDYDSLIRIGILNFIVALCESATVFHDLHHLTLNQEITYLQLYQSNSALDSFFMNTAYLVAFIIGHTAFSVLFCYTILKANEKLCSFTGWTLPKTAGRIKKIVLIAILALTFSTFPYYGLDYLFTKSAGFLPEDPAYSNTIFSPTQVRSRNRHFKSRAPAVKNAKTVLELDLNYFDRGMYLNAPKEEKIAPQLQEKQNPSAVYSYAVNGGSESDALSNNELNLGTKRKTESQSLSQDGESSNLLNNNISENSGDSQLTKTASNETVTAYDPALTFEELNYQGEAAWLMRHERARRLPEEQDAKKSSIFQKPKSHFKELRLQQDNKQARAALFEATQIGPISDFKEGNRVAENFPADIEKFDSGEKQLQKEAHQSAFLKQLFFDREIQSNYEKSFTSPFGEESEGTPPDLLPVENIIKKRYRLNPVYRALLQSDIDCFIARQPADYKITQNQEVTLFKKRQLLEKYYNSIRYYSPIESIHQSRRIKEFTQNDMQVQGNQKTNSPSTNHTSSIEPSANWQTDNPTKSFVEMAYHQQFKGTVNTVKRFFKLTFDEQQNPNKTRILSYDQPLYKNPLSLSSREHKNKYHPSLHEELALENVPPFLEESNSAPVYAGWDEKARRFVITNRFNFIN